MAKIKTHMEDCIRLIGDGHRNVHEHLDAFTKQYPIHTHLEYHRKFRHTEKYVNESNWGFYRKLAAKIHIIRDYELYVLRKPFSMVEIEEIDGLWEKVKGYLHK